jgi:regulator of ribonuclease activity A
MPKSTCDLCDENESLVAVLELPFNSYGGAARCCGRIQTIKCHEDNSRVRECVELDGQGRVLVVDGGGSLRRSLVGDMLAERALAHGWQGILVNGAVRDIDALAALQIGIFALGTTPMRTAKKGVGEAGVVLRFAGVSFTPGAYLYADRNGIVVAAEALEGFDAAIAVKAGKP